MEKTILSHLIVNEAYCRRVIPYLNDDLFPWQAEKTLFGIIESYVEKYNAIPTKEILYIELENIDSQSQDQFNEAQTYILRYLSTHTSDMTTLKMQLTDSNRIAYKQKKSDSTLIISTESLTAEWKTNH